MLSSFWDMSSVRSSVATRIKVGSHRKPRNLGSLEVPELTSSAKGAFRLGVVDSEFLKSRLGAGR